MVKYYNLDHEDAPIRFDRTPFEQSDALLSSIVSGTLGLRVGDVSRDSWEDARAQSGEDIHVDRSTIDDYADNVEDELKDADITIHYPWDEQ